MANFDSLLQSALTALAAGRTDTARRLLTSLVASCPQHEIGWLYLAAALPNEQAIQSLQRVLVINPVNKQALRALQHLRLNPDVRLDLADVMIEVEIEAGQSEIAVFSDEPPTIPEAQLHSILSAEPATMPQAFRGVLDGKSKQPRSMMEQKPETSIIGSLLAEDWTLRPGLRPSRTEKEKETEQKPEPGVIGSLLAEDWTLRPAAPLPDRSTLRAKHWSEGKKEACEINEKLQPGPPKNIRAAHLENPGLTKLPLRSEVRPTSSWIKQPVTEASITSNMRVVNQPLPASAIYVDPHSIEGRVANLNRRPTAPPIQPPARRVEPAPIFNSRIPLPVARPSSQRRYRRNYRASSNSFTSLGYMVFIMLIIVIIIYLYLALQQPAVALNP